MGQRDSDDLQKDQVGAGARAGLSGWEKASEMGAAAARVGTYAAGHGWRWL